LLLHGRRVIASGERQESGDKGFPPLVSRDRLVDIAAASSPLPIHTIDNISGNIVPFEMRRRHYYLRGRHDGDGAGASAYRCWLVLDSGVGGERTRVGA